MTKIIENQTLEINNLLSYKNTIRATDLDDIGKKMNEVITLAGASTCGYPITATFETNNDLLDIELLIPINKKIISTDQFVFKEKIKITNAVVAIHIGNVNELQQTCNELNQYILDNKLIPLTVGYNITKKINPLDANDTEIHVYVGINANIL